MSETALLIAIHFNQEDQAQTVADFLLQVRRDVHRTARAQLPDLERQIAAGLRELIGARCVETLYRPYYSEADKAHALRQATRTGEVDVAGRRSALYWRRPGAEGRPAHYWAGKSTEFLLVNTFCINGVEILPCKSGGYLLELDLACGDEAPLKQHILSLAFSRCGFQVRGVNITDDLQDEEDEG